MDQRVFVSHSSKDGQLARGVVAALETRGIRCWIAPRDMTPGTGYAAALMQALDRCRLLVLVLTEAAMSSPHVLREIDRAVARGLSILPFRADRAPFPEEIEYLLSPYHYLDASGGSVDDFLPALVRAVEELLAGRDTRPPHAPDTHAFRIERHYPHPIAGAYRLMSAFDDGPTRLRHLLGLVGETIRFLGVVLLAEHLDEATRRQRIEDVWRRHLAGGEAIGLAEWCRLVLRLLPTVRFVPELAGVEGALASATIARAIELQRESYHGRHPAPGRAGDLFASLASGVHELIESLAFLPLYRLVHVEWCHSTARGTEIAYLDCSGPSPEGFTRHARLAEAPLEAGRVYLLSPAGDEALDLSSFLSHGLCPADNLPHLYLFERAGPKGIQMASYVHGHRVALDEVLALPCVLEPSRSTLSRCGLQPRSEGEADPGLASGRRLAGRYRVEGLLGEGGMGQVYRAVDEDARRAVAIKILPPVLARSARRVARFDREVQALVRLADSPGVVRILDHGIDGDVHYMVEDHLRGATLEERVISSPGGRLSEPEVWPLARGLAAALASVHEAGLVHRDVKPSNVVVGPDGAVTLIDFGVVRLPAEETLTKEEGAVGTVLYSAPEQLADPSSATTAADVFAFGLVVARTLAGRAPDPDLRDPLALDRELRELGVSSRLREILLRCLAPRPDERFHRGAELCHALAAGEHSAEAPRTFASGRCRACLAPHAPDSRFCEACGGEILRPCPVCEHDNRARARFCSFCGSRLDADAAAGASIDDRLREAEELLERGEREAALKQLRAIPEGESDDRVSELLARVERARRPRYEVLERLGRGGMGSVYLGIEKATGRKVAIKTIEAQMDAEANARFAREARIGQALDHPNLVRTFDVCEIEGTPAIVTEYVEGRTLQEIVREHGMARAGQIVWTAGEILAGLSYLHEQSVIHRDIKPSNVFVDRCSSRLKLGDLGLAKDLGTPITREGDAPAVGTLSYMSPEVVDGSPVDGRADIYAIGVTLYELAAGRLPFVGRSQMQVVRAILMGTKDPLASLRPDLPSGLCGLIERMMAVRIEDRPASAEEARRQLEALGITSVPLAIPSEEPRPEPREPEPGDRSIVGRGEMSVVLEARGRIRYASTRFSRWLGLDRGELVGRNLVQVPRFPFSAELIQRLLVRAATEPAGAEVEAVATAGGRYRLHASADEGEFLLLLREADR